MQGLERRSAQTVIHETADALCRILAPILSFTAEEAYGYLPGHAASVFLAGMPQQQAEALVVDADAAYFEHLRYAAAINPPACSNRTPPAPRRTNTAVSSR